jgi:hypothetical protein
MDDNGQQPRDEEDQFFFDLCLIRSILKEYDDNRIADFAFHLVKEDSPLAGTLAFELNQSLKQKNRMYRR